MGRHIVKGLTMFVLLLTVAFASATAASGQSNHKLTARIPFDFIVGDKVLAAGQYQVNEVGIAGDALAIQSTESKYSAIRLTSATAPEPKQSARLVFRRYGNTYFLSQVWEGGDNVGRKLQKSRQERAMDRELSRIARNANAEKCGYEEVVILASVR